MMASVRQPIFRQLDEKHLTSESDLMISSPKMDLIAVANIQGEVTLHRLISWQKVWVLSPPSESMKVGSMAWRPDGKVLAVGYTTDCVLLCDTENKEILHTNKITGSATFLRWISELESPVNDHLVFQDDSKLFLPKLPSLSKTYSAGGRSVDDHAEDSKKLGDQTVLNVLVVGTDHGMLYLYAFGLFPCLEYSLKSAVSSDINCLQSATISNDFSHLFVVVEILGERSSLRMLTFELSLLTSRRRELHSLAMKYGQISSLLSYISSTIQSIIESWEDILLEMDTKLMNYAKVKRRTSTDTISNDFLELLVFGTPSSELENFLLHDLTEKGLKKLGHSIELSYSNIQKLVLKHLQNVGQAIVYHLSDVRGMALWYDRFGVLGLSSEAIDACIAESGAFMLKATEIQQVIDNSMKNFKFFFRWLYVVILRLSDEPATGEINEITQQDLHFVAQFLKENFTASSCGAESAQTSFNLERVGQYLRNEDLQFSPDLSANPWMCFTKANPQLTEDGLLYSYPTKRSLVQQHALLREEIDGAFDRIASVVGQMLFPCQTIELSESIDVPVVRQNYVALDGSLYTVYAGSAVANYFVFVHRVRDGRFRAIRVKFDELGMTADQCPAHNILDFQFYNDETLSLLLVEQQANDDKNNRTVLLQLPMKVLLERTAPLPEIRDAARSSAVESSEFIETINGGTGLNNATFQRLNGLKALRLAVSGPRRIVCVMFASRRRVRLFEMDIEEEEEDLSVQNDDLEDRRSSRGGATAPLADCAAAAAAMIDDKENDDDKENFMDS